MGQSAEAKDDAEPEAQRAEKGPAPSTVRPDPEEVKKDKANKRIEQFYTEAQRQALAKQRESIERTIELSQSRSREAPRSRSGSPDISARGRTGSARKKTPRASYEQLQLKEEIRQPAQAAAEFQLV